MYTKRYCTFRVIKIKEIRFVNKINCSLPNLKLLYRAKNEICIYLYI